MRYWRKSVKPLVLLTGVLLSLSLAETLFAKVVDRVVAKVNGEIVTLSNVEERAVLLKQQMQSSPTSSDISDGDLIKDALNSLIEEKLQLQEAKKAHLEVDEEAVDKAIDDIKTKNNISDADLEKMLEMEGRSLEQYREHISNQILGSKVVRFNMGKSSKITDKQIKEYYFEHQKEYWVPRQPFVRHILFIADQNLPEKGKQLKRAKANLILKKIQSGQDFSEMAKKYSEDVSASSGGEIGLVTKGNLVPEFEEVAFSLKEGEISDVVESRYGYHIIKVDRVIDGESKSLDEMKEQIRNILAFQDQRKRYKDWMDELKKEAMIEVTLFEDKSQKENRDKQLVLETESTEDDSRKGTGDIEADENEWEEASNANKKRAASNVGLQRTQFTSMEKKLTYIKKLREKRKISEEEYQRRKQRLLDQL